MVEWLPVSRTCLLRNSHGNLATLALTYSAHIQYPKKDKMNSLRLWLSFFWRSFCSARRSSSERGSSCFSFSYKQFQIDWDYIDPKYADIQWRWSWLNDLDWETLETWGGLWGELVEKVQEGAGVHLPRHHVHVVVLHHLFKLDIHSECIINMPAVLFRFDIHFDTWWQLACMINIWYLP